jgi:hypothetical protein
MFHVQYEIRRLLKRICFSFTLLIYNIRIELQIVDICNRMNATQHIICIYCYIRRYLGFRTFCVWALHYYIIVFGGYQTSNISLIYMFYNITMLPDCGFNAFSIDKNTFRWHLTSVSKDVRRASMPFSLYCSVN